MPKPPSGLPTIAGPNHTITNKDIDLFVKAHVRRIQAQPRGPQRSDYIKKLYKLARSELGDYGASKAIDAISSQVTGSHRSGGVSINQNIIPSIGDTAKYWHLFPGNNKKNNKETPSTAKKKHKGWAGDIGLGIMKGIAGAAANAPPAPPVPTREEQAWAMYNKLMQGGPDAATKKVAEAAVNDIIGLGNYGQQQLDQASRRLTQGYSEGARAGQVVHDTERARLAAIPEEMRTQAQAAGGQGQLQYDAAAKASAEFTAASEASRAAASAYTNQLDAAGQEYMAYLKGAISAETSSQAQSARTNVAVAGRQADQDAWSRFMDVLGIGMKEDEMSLSMLGTGAPEATPGLFSKDYFEGLPQKDTAALEHFATQFDTLRTKDASYMNQTKGVQISRFIEALLAAGQVNDKQSAALSLYLKKLK